MLTQKIVQKLFFNDIGSLYKHSNLLSTFYCKPFHIYNTSGFHTSSKNAVKYTSPYYQKSKSEIIESKEKPFAELSLEQKIKQTGKDAGYTGVILIGLGITGFMFYAVGRELFSSQSPNGMYTKAYKMCRQDERVQDALGQPIKAYGEANSRGRRRYVSSFFTFLVSQGFGVEHPGEDDYYIWETGINVDSFKTYPEGEDTLQKSTSKTHIMHRFSEYEESNIRVMNIEFHLEGSIDKARVFVEARQNHKGKFEIMLVVVELHSYPHKTITVLDLKEILTTSSNA